MAGIDENTILLLHGDAVEDASQYQYDITNHGVTVSADQSKFSGKSLYFYNSGYFTVDIPDVFAGTADWTVDWWEYRTANNANGAVVSKTFAANGGLGILIGQDINNNLYFFGSSGSQWDIAPSTLMGTQILNTWVHRAVTRNAGTIRTFENGEQKAEVSSSASIGATMQPLTVGRYDYQTGGYYPGYLCEFRVSNIARWTENFTPPDKPYSAVPQPASVSALPRSLYAGQAITVTWPMAEGITESKLVKYVDTGAGYGEPTELGISTQGTYTDTNTQVGKVKYGVAYVLGDEVSDYTESEESMVFEDPVGKVYGGAIYA